MTREEVTQKYKHEFNYDNIIYDLFEIIDKLEKQLARHETYMNAIHPHRHNSELYDYFKNQSL